LAIIGARITSIYLNWLAIQRGQTRASIISELLDWDKTVKPALIGAVSGAISLLMGKIFAE
jgi:hypothetical protein